MENLVENEIEAYCSYDTGVWLRSCKKEVTVPIAGKSLGTIPKWLNGVLYQNGGGMWEIGNSSFKHLFDCMALLHRYEIKDGVATYQCRFLESSTYKKNIQANRIVVSDFGTAAVPDPCHTIFQKISASFKQIKDINDNASLLPYPFGDELYSFTELPFLYRINKDNLQTETKRNFLQKGIVHHSSHPHTGKDGTVYTMAMMLTTKGIYHGVVGFPSASGNESNESMFEKAHVVAKIPARWPLHPSYMHSFGITRNYFIIIEQPLNIFFPKLLLNRVTNNPVHGAMKTFKNELTQISIVSRATGKLSYKFYASGFFYFHLINSFEHDNHIVLDACSFKDATVMECMYREALKNAKSNPNFANMMRSTPVRYVLPLTNSFEDIHLEENFVTLKGTEARAYLQRSGKVLLKPETLCNISCDTPTINYDKHSGEPYRYFYAMGIDMDKPNPGTVVKVDTVTKSAKKWYETDCYPSEPIFVPSPNAQEEDDGVVLIALLKSANAKSVDLVVLDAKNLTEIGRSEFNTPCEIPKIFHGFYLNNDTK